jgi:hypothetical protein
VNLEAVQMNVAPAERGLENAVQVNERRLVGDQQATPDQRAHCPQHDAQLIDGRGLRCSGFGHRAIFARRIHHGRDVPSPATFNRRYRPPPTVFPGLVDGLYCPDELA